MSPYQNGELELSFFRQEIKHQFLILKILYCLNGHMISFRNSKIEHSLLKRKVEASLFEYESQSYDCIGLAVSCGIA